MSPALLLVLFILGSLLLVGGALGWALGALPMSAGIGLVATGSVLESLAVLVYARQKKAQR